MWPEIASVLDGLNYFGTLVSAISGALLAVRKGMDPVGALFLALAAGLGGGTLRDLLLGLTPVFWIRTPAYLTLCAAAALLVFLVARFVRLPERALIWADAIGLATFTVAGTLIALAVGVREAPAVAMGMMTATGGGVLRDLLCAERPMVMGGELYVTCVLVGATALVGLLALGLPIAVAALAAFAASFLLRAAAIVWHLRLPKGRSRS